MNGVKSMLKGQILVEVEVFSADDIITLSRTFQGYAEVTSVSARCDLRLDDESEDE